MGVAPSGQQWRITHGAQHATVVEVGGGVREYRWDGRDVLHPYAEDAMCDGAHGTPLIPWPNRLRDGRYSWDGVAYQAPLTEVGKDNAIHGFTRWRSFVAREHTESAVVVGAVVRPMKHYPFTLDVAVRYSLDDHGLTVTTTARNLGDAALPYALGQHPYLSPGDGTIDDAVLQVPAATRIDTDAQRQLPSGLAPVAGTGFDFRAPRAIGSLAMDYAFTDLERDDDGRAWVELTGADGRTVALWAGPEYPVLEIYTADTLDADRRRRGLGVEPMSAPPNAFQTGQGVLRISPGAQVVHRWGVLLRP